MDAKAPTDLATVAPPPGGEPQGYAGIAPDALLRLVLESLSDGVVVADVEGRFILTNQVAHALVGTPLRDSPAAEWPLRYGVFLRDTVTPFPAEELPLAKAVRGESTDGVKMFIRNEGIPRGAWLSVSGRPLLHGPGRLLGGVIVFRDVSDRVRAEFESSRLAALVRSSDDAIILKDTDGKIVEWNPAAERLYGWSAQEAVGRNIEFLFPPDRRDEARVIVARLLNGQHVEHHQTVRVRKDGSRIDVSLSSSVVRGPDGAVLGISTIARDITELKRAVEAETERRANAVYRELFETVPIGLFRSSAEGRIIDVNPALARLLGYDSFAELATTSTKSFYLDPADRERWLPRASEPGVVREADLQIRRRDGSIGWVHGTARAVVRPDGALAYYEGSIRDITARKRAEDEARNMTRALRVLSAGNQALLKATSEQELLERLCRVVVEVGGYRFAWVGKAEEDAGKTVRPLARAGHGDGHLEELRGTWSDGDSGRGPVGTAIRSGKRVIVRDLAHDPLAEPWWGKGPHRGHASVAAFPLHDGERVSGCLAIYAGEADAFDWREVEILAELSEDLAFGLRTLRAGREREEARRALARSEERFRKLVEHSSEVLVLVGRDQKIIYTSPSVTKVLGYDPREIIGLGSAELAHPEDQKSTSPIMEDLLRRSGAVVAVEARIRHKDGSWRWMAQVAVNLLDDPAVCAVVTHWRDINSRRQALEAMRASEERFRLVSKAARETIWEWDIATSRVEWSEGMSTFFGYLEGQVGRTFEWWVERIHPGERDRVTNDVGGVLKGGGGAWATEYRFRSADGSYALVSHRGYVIRNASGEGVRMVGTMVDVTEREAGNRLREELLDLISHEFRTPLTVIQGYADLQSSEGPAIDEVAARRVRLAVDRAARRLTYLLSAVTELNALRTGAPVVAAAPLQTAEVVNEALATVEWTGRLAERDIRVEVGPGSERISSDRRKLVIALTALIDNAVKYSPQGTPVRVGVTADHSGLVVEVEDEGPGLPPEVVRNLGKPFLQADMSSTRLRGGVGLGLAIVVAATKSLGGRLEFEARTPRGTRARVVLPWSGPA